jgi:hypothetical protein
MHGGSVITLDREMFPDTPVERLREIEYTFRRGAFVLLWKSLRWCDDLHERFGQALTMSTLAPRSRDAVMTVARRFRKEAADEEA